MEVYFNKICLEKDPEKQKKMIMKLMKMTDFSHPVILPLLQEFKLTPEELKDQNEGGSDITDRKGSVNHHKARRLAKIEVLAEVVQQRGVFSGTHGGTRKSLQNSPSKNIKSYKSILESEPDVPLSIPLNLNVISQRLIDSQTKKLERLLKVSENIKTLKIEEEKRKKGLSKDIEEKHEKIKQSLILAEEERTKKKVKAETNRESKLKKKYEVKPKQEIDIKELKVIEEFRKIPQKIVKHERSKTGLILRANQNRSSDNESLDWKLDSIKAKIDRSIARAQKIRFEKLKNSSSKRFKIAKALENKHQIDLEEGRKIQEIIGNLNQTLEHSRQKRQEKLIETTEKISEKLTARFEKLKSDFSKEEERFQEKQIEAQNKEIERDRVRNYMKNWYIQQGQLISEINRLRKQDQSENLNKYQANQNEFKLKILFKHLNKEKTLKQIEKTRNKLEKLRNDTTAKIVNKKEKDSQDLQQAISELHKKIN